MSLNTNWVDLIIILVLLYFALQALHHGFWAILSDFVSFLGSLLISLRAYKFASGLLRDNFALSHSVANALGFLVTAIVTEAILGTILGLAIAKLPEKVRKSKLNQLMGMIPALGEGLVLIAFILTLTLGLPVKPSIKRDIADSKLGGFILQKTSGIEKVINEVFGGVIDDSLTYLIIKPGSRESVPITVDRYELRVDEAAETAMFRLVNEERKKRGTKELEWRSEVVPVARAHAKDMWERKYFSHISFGGKDAGDRLEDAGISYTIAGENLALAPTVVTAHTGLMNSEGHRANILEPRFKRVGIGVIDNGIYGKMFVQVFTD